MIKFGTQFNQRDILIVLFPFSNLRAIIQRPVLVLSNNNYNKNSEDIVTCGITSNLKDTFCSVVVDNSNLSKGKIPIQSRIKVDKLFTIEKRIVRKKIARLNNETFEQIKKEFLRLI